MNSPLRRRNLLDVRPESWRPPAFRPVVTRRDRVAAALRRVLDLQAASIWRDLVALLPAARGAVLDVGAGAQPYRALLGPGTTYRAIDSAAAGASFGYSVAGTTYYEGDRWPVADESVDVVLSTETLEHVPDPSTFLAEAARCLRPGGRLVLTVPFAARWHYIPHDYWRFTPTGLNRLLSAAGFERAEVFARGNALTVACYKVMALALPWLVARRSGLLATLACRAVGFVSLPALLVLGLIGQLSMAGEGGDDCLGYTVVADKGPGTGRG